MTQLEKAHNAEASVKQETPKLAIICTIQVAPGRRNQLLLMAHRARCLKDESGTLQFEVLVPRDDDTGLPVYGVFRDDVAYDMHLGGPSIAQWRKETAIRIVKLHMTRCALAASVDS